MPHIYSAQQLSGALTPWLVTATSAAIPGDSRDSTNLSPALPRWDLLLSLLSEQQEAQTFLPASHALSLQVYQSLLAILSQDCLSGSHNVLAAASTLWSHSLGTRGRGAKSYSGLLCWVSFGANRRGHQQAAKIKTSLFLTTEEHLLCLVFA